jgi:hypothetical protein
MLALSTVIHESFGGSNESKHSEQSNLRKKSAQGRNKYVRFDRVYFRLPVGFRLLLGVFACTTSSGLFPRFFLEGPTNESEISIPREDEMSAQSARIELHTIRGPNYFHHFEAPSDYPLAASPTTSEAYSKDITEAAEAAKQNLEGNIDRSGMLSACSGSFRCNFEYGRSASSQKHFPGPWDAVLSLRFAALTPATTTACGYNATQPPTAPLIESVRSDEDGSLIVKFNTPAGTPAGWQEAMVIDSTNQKMWHYESPHWTSAELLDDGINNKTMYFNRAANRIKVEMHYAGSVRSVVWSHNLGKSLQQIFAEDEFVASDIPEKDWHDVLGVGVAGVDTNWAVQGFNARYVTNPWPLGEKLGARLGIYMSSLYIPSPNAMIGVGLQALEGWTSGDADRADLAPAAGASVCITKSPLGFDCTSHTATKVVVYVDDGACVNYHITTNPPTPATVVNSSPATVTGLQLTSMYEVEVGTVNTAGTSSMASALGTSKPCRCACSLPKAAAITSIDSHQPGTVTVNFDAPADTPADCTLNYTLRASPGDAVTHVVASPATLTGLDTSSVSYTIGITASNLLGSGPTSFATAGILSSANDWDGLTKFVASIQPESAATFVLGPGVLTVSRQIIIANINMTIRGSAAGGTVLDARKLCMFFQVKQRGILRLYGPLTLTLVNCDTGGTGAIDAIGRSQVFARRVTFTRVSSEAIYAKDSRVELIDCNFTENATPAGMATITYFYSCTPYSSAADDEDVHVLSITGSRFERNAAPAGYSVRS